jgi:hypothetical protein
MDHTHILATNIQRAGIKPSAPVEGTFLGSGRFGYRSQLHYLLCDQSELLDSLWANFLMVNAETTTVFTMKRED